MPLGANKAAIMGVAGVSTGDVVLLDSQTADGDSEIEFTSGITSTYGEYIFGFYNINPSTAGQQFGFQANVSGQSGYNETITSSAFLARHKEGDETAEMSYTASADQGQGTAFQFLSYDATNDADASIVGKLHLFNPSSTTYVKHFYATINEMIRNGAGASSNLYIAGYFNVTGAIDEIQFKTASGDFDGTIKMWGVK